MTKFKQSWLLFLVLLWLGSAGHAAEMCSSVFKATSGTATKAAPYPYDLQTLRRKLYAVHATNYLPPGNTIEPRANIKPGNFRISVHFSLGMLVQPHAHSWEQKKYAVILPLHHLEPQLSSLMVHDTFTLGAVRLPKEAIILMPANDPTPDPSGVRVRRYTNGEPLRDVIEKVIREQGGWTLTAKEGDGLAENPAFIAGT